MSSVFVVVFVVVVVVVYFRVETLSDQCVGSVLFCFRVETLSDQCVLNNGFSVS